MKHVLRWLTLALFLCLAVASYGVQVQTGILSVVSSERDSLLAVEIAQHLQPLIDDFQIKVGMFADFPLLVVVTADHAEYQAVVNKSGGVLEFSEAHYNRRQQTVYLRHPNDMRDVQRLGTILLHEYIHAYVDHYWRDAPLWFHEGMAVYFSEGVGLERSARYALAALAGDPLTLPQMNNYPDGAASWEMYYTKSALAVQYLYTQRRESFFDLWEAAPRYDGRFHNTLAATMGLTVDGLSGELERWLRVKVRWESVLAGSTMIWSLAPVLVLLGWVRSKIRNRRTKRGWETEEANEEQA